MALDPVARGGAHQIGIADSMAERAVEHLGFLVVNGTSPEAQGGANLVVALRDKPTLAHFDPERIDHWVAAAGRGKATEIDHKTAVPFERPFSWGTIRVVDRLEVSNSFLTFGGTIRAFAAGSGATIVVFSSPAPLVRAAGHSQGVDLSTGEIGAFFARAMIPIDFEPGAEARIAAEPPMTLYAAFQASVGARLRASNELRAAHPGFTAWCRRERGRLAESFPADWEEGQALARDLGLDRP